MRVAAFKEVVPNVIIIQFEAWLWKMQQRRTSPNTWLNLANYSREKTPFNILLDGRDVRSLPARYAIQHGLFFARNKKLTEKLIEKSAIVISSKTVRKILNIVFTIYTPKSDLIITRDIEKAAAHVSRE